MITNTSGRLLLISNLVRDVNTGYVKKVYWTSFTGSLFTQRDEKIYGYTKLVDEPEVLPEGFVPFDDLTGGYVTSWLIPTLGEENFQSDTPFSITLAEDEQSGMPFQKSIHA